MTLRNVVQSNSIICLLIASALYGCGGGGESSSPPPPNVAKYTVDTSVQGFGSVSPMSMQVESGGTASFTLSSAENNTIVDASGCGGQLDGTQFVTSSISSNCTVQVEFSKVIYAPESISVSAIESGAQLSWSSAANATIYNVYVSRVPDFAIDDEAVKLFQTEIESLTVEGLLNYTEYYFRISSQNNDVFSDLSEVVSIVPKTVYAFINDTGITTCYDGVRNDLDCPVNEFPSQDAEHGRDAALTDGTLLKVGGGAAGFDFSKLDANGEVLPLDAVNWSCVRDNNTGLVWEVKTNTNDWRDYRNTYSFYDSSFGPQQIVVGKQNGGNCNHEGCDTEAYIALINEAKLCGSAAWRLPERYEMLGIVHNGKTSERIDLDFFPNTMLEKSFSQYWTKTQRVSSENSVWGIEPGQGRPSAPSMGSSEIYLRAVFSLEGPEND